ncbi:MAG: FAD-binding protein [Lachnospiraceae bacterium]|nr:FAD-binding protein [Lachnospiraceae bacterium]
MIQRKTDVLIVGAGGAACRAAIAAADAGSKVLIATKKPIGVAGATTFPVAEMAGYNAGDPNVPGDIEKHYQDIVMAGGGMADERLAKILAEQAPETITTLEEWGVEYEHVEDDYYIFQSCFSNWPRTHVIKGHGEPIVNAMAKQIAVRPQISCMDNLTITELIVRDGRCQGAFGWVTNEDGSVEEVRIAAGAVILAAGGACQAFERNMNPTDVSGDGYALAKAVGAEFVNMEFMQSGLGFSYPIINMFNAYIWLGLPELTNKDGEAFLAKYLPEGLTPADVMREHRKHFPFSSSDISRYLEISVQKELLAGNGTENRGVYVDLRKMTDEYVASLPDDCGIHHMWYIARDFMRSRGVDLLSQTAEICCFAHAINGGVKIDENAGTTVPGLYAAGENAGGPHGADRLGGNMMVTCQVFGKIAGEAAAKWATMHSVDEEALPTESSDRIQELLKKRVDVESLLARLRYENQRKLLVCRTKAGLEDVLANAKMLEEEIMAAPVGDGISLDNFRLQSLIDSTVLMATAAKAREKSCGSHYREDDVTMK